MKKKRYVKQIDYKKLFLDLVRSHYINLTIGLIIALMISSFLYSLLFGKNGLKVKFPTPKFMTQKPKPSPVPTKKPKVTYQIQKGDDLWHIAEKYYGSGFNAYDISVANRLSDASILEPGQKIVIPSITPRQATIGEISAASSAKVTNTEGKYVVQPGDSLSSIALKVYGDLNSWPTILKTNRLQNADQIEIGMILSIPR